MATPEAVGEAPQEDAARPVTPCRPRAAVDVVGGGRDRLGDADRDGLGGRGLAAADDPDERRLTGRRVLLEQRVTHDRLERRVVDLHAPHELDLLLDGGRVLVVHCGQERDHLQLRLVGAIRSHRGGNRVRGERDVHGQEDDDSK